jgi:hypothetical protein
MPTPESLGIKVQPEVVQPPNVYKGLPGRGGMSGNAQRSPSAPTVEVQTEAPAPEAPVIDPKVGQVTGGNDGGSGNIGMPTWKVPGPPKKKGPDTIYSAHGTISETLSPAERAKQAAHAKRIQDAEQLTVLADLRASGATEEQMYNWVEISNRSAEEAQNLYNDHFKPLRAKMQQLEQRVDDARSLKVNPYNWSSSIGRGGRTAAAFAALTGGFAAGKMNPNSAVMMMDSAIERDIAAQVSNIKLQYENISAAQGLMQDERALYAEQLSSINEIKAMNYASILGRIQAAQQTAVTEAHFLAYQVAYDHYEMKLLEALAAAKKELLRIEVDGPIYANQAAHVQAQVEEIQRQLNAGGGPGGPVDIPTSLVANRAGETFQPTTDIARLTPVSQGAGQGLAPAPSRAASVASRGPSRGVGSGAPKGRPQGATSQDVGAQPQGPTDIQYSAQPQLIEDTVTGESRMETPEEAQARAQGQETKAVARETQRATEQQARQKAAAEAEAKRLAPYSDENISRFVENDPDHQIPHHVAQNGSYARTIRKDANLGVKGVLTWGQGVRMIMRGQAFPPEAPGMTGTEDARVVSSLIPPTDPSMYKDGVENDGYKEAERRRELGLRFPEIYERPSSRDNEENSTIQVGGRTYIVRAGHRGKEEYTKAKEDIIKSVRVTDGLMQMATLISKNGLSGIFTSEGLQLPGITDPNPAMMEVTNRSIIQAIDFMKTQDPTARLSDQDRRAGEQAMGEFLSGKATFIDALQSLDGKFEDNTKRQQIERFLIGVAIEAERILNYEAGNAIVPDYQTLLKASHRSQRLYEWIAKGQENK